MGATLFVLFAVASSLTPGAAAAHVGQLIYPFYEIPRADLPDLSDGDVLDWEAAVPGPSLQLGDLQSILGIGDGTSIDPGDLTYQIYLGWSSETQRIYVAVESVDDIYVNDYGGTGLGSITDNDSVTFMVDGDHSGGRYTFYQGEDGISDAKRRRLTGSTAQLYHAIAASPDRHVDAYGALWLDEAPWTEAGGLQRGENPSYSLVELAVTPWDEIDPGRPDGSVGSTLSAGRIVGFQIALVDFDDTIRRQDNVYVMEGYYNIGGISGEVADASLFADGILVGYGEAFPAGSAVRPSAWARIKAAAAASRNSARP